MSEHKTEAKLESVRLGADDLIVDRALEETDQDALQHRPVAERVADLVASSVTPLNVALFGPWGSGKSSFAQLLKRSLTRYPRVALVTYNAWTFEGESLQRSFISSVATALDMREEKSDDYIQFHSGLYEHRRSARVKLKGWDIAKVAGVAIAVGATVLALLIAVVALIAHWVGEDVVKAVVAAIPSLLPVTAVTALLGSVIREIIAGARVEVDASAPTQEQFRAKFGKLVARALTDKHLERLVIFIDELDRCSPEQVVLVLAAVRHFFDQPNCVFVVAADREVVERALKDSAEHATPLNTENPYYSSASEYIDKVFQHQVALPPLRGRRLTRFARDLVEAKTAGLWADLAKGNKGRLRDQLVYILVPSHVRSPRRVKVLLNNFATNYRVAESRGTDAYANATAIAKLSALQTEFPLFAADLIKEPRLPALLFAPPTNPTARVAELLERHELPAPASRDGSSLSETEPVLADVSDQESQRLKLAQRTLLRRYLVRTNQFPNPSRDLLYLEPAGAPVNLIDPVFGELLETASIEEPQVVLNAAQHQPREEVGKAARLLADMVSQEFGEERTNVVTALLGLVEQLQFDVAPHGDEMLGALKLQLNEEGFTSEQLTSVLALALNAEGEDRSLSAAIIGDPRLMEDADRTRSVASVADKMTTEQRQVVWNKVVEFYPTNPAIAIEPVSRLSPDVAQELIYHPGLSKAMRDRWNSLPAEDAATEIDALLQAAADRSGESEGIRGALLLRMPTDAGNGYAGLLRHESDLVGFKVRPGFRTMIALKAIRVGLATDWRVWTAHLDAIPKPWKDQTKEATSTAISIITRLKAETAGIESESLAAISAVAKLILSEYDPEFAAAVVEPGESALDGGAWWNTDPEATAQRHLQAGLLRLGVVGPTTRAALSRLVVNDIERGISSGPNSWIYISAGECAQYLDMPNLSRLGKAIAEAAPQPGLLDYRARSRLEVAKAAQMQGEAVQADPFLIDADEVISYLETPARAEVLAGWFELAPEFDAGLKVAESLGPSAPANERSSVVGWALSLSPEQRTDLVLRISALADDTSDWVADLTREAVDEDALIAALSERVRSSTRGEERADLARTIAALRPGRPSAQRSVAQLVVWLLDQEKRVDDDAAVILLPALGSRHRMGPKLSEAVARAAGRGAKFRNRALEDLKRANVPLKKKGIPGELWDRIRRLGKGR